MSIEYELTEEIVKYIDKVSTPSYIYDVREVDRCIDMMKSHLGGSNLCFAIKANPFLVKYIIEKVDRLEVCSPGEYELCKYYKVEPNKIVVSGVHKTYDSLTRILEYSKGEGVYTIESRRHYELLSQVAKQYGYKLDVIVRLSSGNQFGIDKEGLEAIVADICGDKCNSNCDDACLRLKGIHYYSGTQKKMAKIEKELVMLDGYISELKSKYQIEELELEYGPSLMTSYFEDGKDIDTIEQLEQIKVLLDNIECIDTITLEFGRFMVASCGMYITRIDDIKRTGDLGYIIVDGGIHQVNYYGQMMGMKKPYMKKICGGTIVSLEHDGGEYTTREYVISGDEVVDDRDAVRWNICGSLCTTNDVLVRDVVILNPHIGDRLVFYKVGAYSATESMALFLTRELPQVCIVDRDGKLYLVRDRKQVWEMML